MTDIAIPAIDHSESPTSQSDVVATLTRIHAAAGALVAELSTSPFWAGAESIVGRLIAETGHVGPPSGTLVPTAPAVVRCRELAVAQRHLMATLERTGGDGLGHDAVVRARALLAELAEPTSAARGRLHR